MGAIQVRWVGQNSAEMGVLVGAEKVALGGQVEQLGERAVNQGKEGGEQLQQLLAPCSKVGRKGPVF